MATFLIVFGVLAVVVVAGWLLVVKLVTDVMFGWWNA